MARSRLSCGTSGQADGIEVNHPTTHRNPHGVTSASHALRTLLANKVFVPRPASRQKPTTHATACGKSVAIISSSLFCLRLPRYARGTRISMICRRDSGSPVQLLRKSLEIFPLKICQLITAPLKCIGSPPQIAFEASALYPGLKGWGSRAHMTSGDAGGTLNTFLGYGNVESFIFRFFARIRFLMPLMW